MKKPVIAIFDVGKTNKKFFLFDDDLKEVYHEYEKLPLAEDEDGFPCDDLEGLTTWIRKTIADVQHSPDYELKGINFSTYGATLVHLDKAGRPVTPLYNYLKQFPEKTLEEFLSVYNQQKNDLETASPTLGMLNSGLQLYWLKKNKPEVFNRIHHTLHFPQYLSYLFTGKLITEPTSIGCHTKLWDYSKNTYHDWVDKEGLIHLFPPLVQTTHSFSTTLQDREVAVGVGVHDSSSALASYMLRSDEPFILISTGTWSITLNAFTGDELTPDELRRDCLNYLNIYGKPVKSSRLFLGNELDHQLKRLNEIFHKDQKYYKSIKLDPHFFEGIRDQRLKNAFYPATLNNPALVNDVFDSDTWEPSEYHSYEEAFHHVIWGLVRLQVASLKLAKGSSSINRIFVDGGFIGNDIFIKLLEYHLPGYSIEVSHLPLGSAYGAATILKNSSVKNGVLLI